MEREEQWDENIKKRRREKRGNKLEAQHSEVLHAFASGSIITFFNHCCSFI